MAPEVSLAKTPSHRPKLGAVQARRPQVPGIEVRRHLLPQEDLAGGTALASFGVTPERLAPRGARKKIGPTRQGQIFTLQA